MVMVHHPLLSVYTRDILHTTNILSTDAATTAAITASPAPIEASAEGVPDAADGADAVQGFPHQQHRAGASEPGQVLRRPQVARPRRSHLPLPHTGGHRSRQAHVGDRG